MRVHIYISDLESWSAFVWSVILVLLCQHSFCDVWSCLSIYSLMLDFFIASSLSISQSVLYDDILCLMLVTILHQGIPLSLSLLGFLQIFSLFDLFINLCESLDQGIPPLVLFYQDITHFFGFITSHANFMVVRPICLSL